MGQTRKRKPARRARRKKVTFNKDRREFLEKIGIATYGAVLARYLPAPAPVAQLPPITGTLNATLEPLVAGVVRFNAFVAVDSVSVRLEESASVERV